MSHPQKRTKIEYPRGYRFAICQQDVHSLNHYQVSNNNGKAIRLMRDKWILILHSIVQVMAEHQATDCSHTFEVS